MAAVGLEWSLLGQGTKKQPPHPCNATNPVLYLRLLAVPIRPWPLLFTFGARFEMFQVARRAKFVNALARSDMVSFVRVEIYAACWGEVTTAAHRTKRTCLEFRWGTN